MMMVMMMMLLMIIIIMMITRFKNGTLVKNSSEYLIKQTANLPDYTTNTLSYVQVVPIISKRRYDTPLIMHIFIYAYIMHMYSHVQTSFAMQHCSMYAHVNVNLVICAVFPSPQHLCLEKRLGQFLILYIPLHHEHH